MGTDLGVDQHDGFTVVDKREQAREAKRVKAEQRAQGQAAWTKQAAATMFWEANHQALEGNTLAAEKITKARQDLLDGAAGAGVALPAGVR